MLSFYQWVHVQLKDYAKYFMRNNSSLIYSMFLFFCRWNHHPVFEDVMEQEIHGMDVCDVTVVSTWSRAQENGGQEE